MLKKALLCCVLFFVALPAHAEETATVITEGLGKDIERAVQMAAEAALTQVVGSFIDSDKLIEKRKEIKDGIKTQTKSISSKLSEYSQGSIERLDVIEVEEEDGLTRVTAKVTVRIEDFKHYIKETVLAEKKIKKGLLGKLKAKEKQAGGVADLLIDKVFNPLLDFQVVIPKIVGEIEAMENPEYLKLFNPGDGEYVLKFDVEVALNPDYLANATRVLEETAKERFQIHNYPELDYAKLKSFNADTSAVIAVGAPFGIPLQATKHVENVHAWLWVRNISFHKPPVFYTYPARNIKLCEKLYKAIGWAEQNSQIKCNTNPCYIVPALSLQFVSADGDILREEILSNKEYTFYAPHFVTNYNSSNKYKTTEVWFRDGSIAPASYDLYNAGMAVPFIRLDVWTYINSNKSACRFAIKSSTTFTIVTKVSEDVLGKTEKITLKYSK